MPQAKIFINYVVCFGGKIMVMLCILISICHAIIARMVWVMYDKINLLENNLEEMAKSQRGIRESMDKTEMDLCEIVGILDDIEDDINELKK